MALRSDAITSNISICFSNPPNLLVGNKLNPHTNIQQSQLNVKNKHDSDKYAASVRLYKNMVSIVEASSAIRDTKKFALVPAFTTELVSKNISGDPNMIFWVESAVIALKTNVSASINPTITVSGFSRARIKGCVKS
jgi:hypothetical protein